MPNESGPGEATLADLRAYINALARTIEDHPEPSFERDEAQWRIEELVAELARPTPSPPKVKSRWIRLAPVLTSLRPDLPIPWLNNLIEHALPTR